MAGSGDDETTERGEETMLEKDADRAMVSNGRSMEGNDIDTRLRLCK